MLFSLLFGLSMDYQVFLLSRIRERYLQTRNTAEAVAFGLNSTGKLITGAALIMVAVFGGFALGDMVMFQQMGFGLAVAVLVDATLVRCVLVPATMTLLGKANWYLPKWLNWLPNISLGETSEEPAAAPAKPVYAPRLPRGLVPVPVPVRVEEPEIERKY
jgi:RND superfamily putative drug exporter